LVLPALQNEPNDQGQVEPNVYIQGFSPTYRPVIKNDYRIAIMNSYGRESNYMVFKDMATLEKKIAIAGIDVGMLARLRQ